MAGCYAIRQLGSVKAQQGLANDPAWAKLLADTAKIADVMGRSLTVSVDL